MNHKILSLSDKLTLLGELEHGRRHCIRSMHSIEDPDEKFYYKVKAKQLQNARRKAEEKWANTDEYNWCLVKVSTKIKQLNEEVFEADDELFSEIENIADDLLSHALHEDLSGCSACREEKEDSIVEEDNIGARIIKQALENEKVYAKLDRKEGIS